MFIFERQRETENENEQGEGQRARETQILKQAPGSELSAHNLKQGSNHGPSDHALNHQIMP